MNFFYRCAWGLVRLVAPVLSIGDSKIARGLAGRRRAHELLSLWGDTIRDPDRPLAWFHAPSVGEGLQAQAVIAELRALQPDLQIVFTFFSPSAEELARSMDVDVSAYLPWDLTGPVGRVLDALKPDMVVFTKTEIWPVLVSEAGRRSIPVAIVAATVPEGAGRSRPMARRLLEPSWRRLSLAVTNSEPDAEQLRGLGVRPGVIEVEGDPGIDSAATRFDARDTSASWGECLRNDARPTVVAGSTWPADEDVLILALEDLRGTVDGLRLVIAPHEPSEAAVSGLLQRLGSAGWRATTLAALEASSNPDGSGELLAPDAIVVERVGVLAALYEVATVSFVGGGFHRRGLHSVLEPAAAGSPVVFGPGHRNARAASDLVALGGAVAAADSAEVARALHSWLNDAGRRAEAGAAAVAYIDQHRGAAHRCARRLHSLVWTTP